MKKIMLLSGHDIDVLQNSSVSKDVFDVYKKGLVYKLAKKSKYTLPFSFAEWTTLLHLYDIVVIFDTYYNEGMVEYIYKINPDIKVIFYCWNSIKTISQRIDIKKIFANDKIEMWSYNRSDCKKYKMKYNPQIWNKELIQSNSAPNFDISFIGSPKHRLDYLREIADYCDKNHLKTYFYITNCKCSFNKNVDDSFLPYEEYIKKIASNSRAILDLVTEENYGLTLRPLEALFLKKKLITNYYEIIDEPFYNESNIYLYGRDNRNIDEFLKIPYEEIQKEVVNMYDCQSWIERFERTE